mgnify:CR=1 FL=1
MLDLIKYIVGQFAEDKENVEYVVTEKDRVIEVNVVLSPSDMGKVVLKDDEIYKLYETKTNFYILLNAKEVMIIVKENCSEELCEFIRNKK